MVLETVGITAHAVPIAPPDWRPSLLSRLHRKLSLLEGPHDCRSGGLHPIHIKDSLDCRRYTVIHKLRHGLSLTV